jgi:hypothetical protein
MPFPNLRADSTYLNPGDCTHIRWDVDDISAIFFGEANQPESGVTGHDSRQVCPGHTTTYRIHLVRRDGGHEYYDITIGIGQGGGGAPPPPSPSGPPTFNFWADSTHILRGQCTTLRWDCQHVEAVWFNEGAGEVGVGGVEARVVCPQNSTTYYLHVRYRDGNNETRNITVNVV